MAPRKRKPTNSTRNGTVDPSKPLAKPSRELFAQDVAAGVPVKDAYARAGYRGNEVSRYELRRCADIDARVNWLLAQRIESDARERAKLVKVEIDAKSRMIAELEAIAYADIGDIVQWDRTPEFDAEGNFKGYRDQVNFTPSRLLTKAQRGAVKAITKQSTRFGAQLKIDTNGKLEAMALLAKVLGFATEAPGAASVTNTQVNVSQVNVGQDNALESLKRLAFAIEKAARARETQAIEAPLGTDIQGTETRRP